MFTLAMSLFKFIKERMWCLTFWWRILECEDKIDRSKPDHSFWIVFMGFLFTSLMANQIMDLAYFWMRNAACVINSNSFMTKTIVNSGVQHPKWEVRQRQFPHKRSLLVQKFLWIVVTPLLAHVRAEPTAIVWHV